MATVGDVLTRAGLAVSEGEFARLVAAALRELGPAPDDDPAGALSAGERRALETIGADLRRRGRREPDPRAAAAAGVAAVLADAVPVAEAAQRLGVDASRVRHRLADRQLFGVRRSDGWRLPSWQFGPDGLPVPGLERVLRALPADAHPVVVTRFFLTPQPELVLGRSVLSPRQWLAGGGDPAPVAALAAGLAVLP